ncbi:DUF4124 domain-containing protein [Pseudazoarcus pumilus]|uniref:DUF4124 domain-containing protein n=1 Tax=Pseudazoarcus pumilus TaxID=2067960 RepID=A0A2I6S7N3_9RHOO|nr:DUF4124 domain-containing protein [Pseudazoarcus pumilus]AUN95231.1 hypothetical protein C0099_10000 [Pseudazoarcus pumilus]
MNRFILTLALALALATSAQAQIFRCDDGKGGTLYTQQPCEDGAQVVDPGPNAELAEGAREAALRREIEQLREDIRRLEEQRAAAPYDGPDYGRSESDLRADQASSYACKQAMRSYEISANSIKRADVEQKRVAMYAACGMREPDRHIDPYDDRYRDPYRRGGTTVIVR